MPQRFRCEKPRYKPADQSTEPSNSGRKSEEAVDARKATFGKAKMSGRGKAEDSEADILGRRATTRGDVRGRRGADWNGDAWSNGAALAKAGCIVDMNGS